MKLLITGFEPFGGESINPAYEAVKALPDTIAGTQIIKAEIPTSFSGSFPAVAREIEAHHPDVVLNIGQANKREDTPCMPISTITQGLIYAIEAVVFDDHTLISESMGTIF